MSQLRRMAWAALAGGLAAGLLLAALQAVWVTPLIHEAETYERNGPAARRTGPAAAAPDEAAAPLAERLRRGALTVAADAVTGVGFALLLVAGMTLHGAPYTAQRGLLWGAGGYAAFVLAPALGLPPELPGAASAELAVRQMWWVGTVAATAGGLAVLALVPHWTRWVGIVLLVGPHVVGAPQVPTGLPELLPSSLAAHFVAATLVTNAVFWAVLGLTSAWVLGRKA